MSLIPKLYPFQETAIKWLLSRRRAVLGSEVGTGKTPVAIDAAHSAAKLGGEYARIYVICPAGLRLMWAAEIEKWTQGPQGIEVVNTSKTFPRGNKRWTIFSYECFVALQKNFKIVPPYVAVFDEAHYLKSPKAQRSITILGKESILRDSQYAWFLTGTPFPNNIVDSYLIFNFCLRGRLGKYWDFARTYAYVKESRWGMQIYGLRQDALPELINKVRPILHRDTIQEHLSELPDYEVIPVPLELTQGMKDIQAELEAIEEQIADAIEEGTKVPDLPHLSPLRMNMGTEKIEQAVAFISDLLEQGNPVVVFAHHVDVVHKISIGLNAPNVEYISGETTQAIRAAHIEQFQAGLIDCLILSIKAAGVGITLTRAHIAVFVEPDWAPASLEQAMARILRIGQKNFCIYYWLYFPNTLDERIFRLLFSKVKQVGKFWEVFEGKILPRAEEEPIVWE